MKGVSRSERIHAISKNFRSLPQHRTFAVLSAPRLQGRHCAAHQIWYCVPCGRSGATGKAAPRVHRTDRRVMICGKNRPRNMVSDLSWSKSVYRWFRRRGSGTSAESCLALFFHGGGSDSTAPLMRFFAPSAKV